MKRVMTFFFLAIFLVACSEVAERPLPKQMLCAQREMDEHHDGIFALYLLSELEDSIGEMPDYIQTRYKLMKSEAEKAKQMQPVYHYQQDDLYHVLRQRDSLLSRQLSEEREAYEQQMSQYRESLRQSHSLQWIGVAVILGIAALLFLHPDWQHRHGLDKPDITPQDLQLCLLSTTTLRSKQVATLLGVSQQNLRNLRVRFYTRITGLPCHSVEQFMTWVRAD